MNLSKENMDHIRRKVEAGLSLSASQVEDLQGHNDHLMGWSDNQARMIMRLEEELRFIRQNWFSYNPLTKTLRSNISVSCDGFQDALNRGRSKEARQ